MLVIEAIDVIIDQQFSVDNNNSKKKEENCFDV